MKIKIRYLLLVGILVFGAFSLPFLYTSGSREYQEVSIPSGGYSLQGYLSEEADPSGAWVIFVHGNRKEGQSHPLYQSILANITKEANVLAIDLAGFGNSSLVGSEEPAGVLDRSQDIVAATTFLQKRYGVSEENIVLIGHSLGAVQVLHASKGHHYQLVISIGPGIFENFLTDEKQMQAYMSKYQENSGLRLTRETMQAEGRRFTTEDLFTPCPETRTILIFGALEKETMTFHQEKLQGKCDPLLDWIVIPTADHMYGTEITGIKAFLQPIYSNTTLSFLHWRLNSLVAGKI